jgi:F420H(2)-dependent quinone reductase
MSSPTSLQAAAIRVYLRLHQAIYEGTDGRIGHRLAGTPSLLLRTTGRRSGARRTSALIYARDGAAYVVVGSNHGLDRDPAWLLNIRADPHVEIQVARQRSTGVAGVIESTDPDYARLWALVNRGNRDRYTGYQASTTRPIPIVTVSPSA